MSGVGPGSIVCCEIVDVLVLYATVFVTVTVEVLSNAVAVPARRRTCAASARVVKQCIVKSLAAIEYPAVVELANVQK